MFKTIPAAALLAITLTAAAPAFAGDTAQVKVGYSDLDLTTMEGQHTLERRLDTAARNACGYDERVTGTRIPSARAQSCYKQAKAKARNVMASAVENARGATGLGG